MSKKRIVIIGAGPGGLCAAILLARAGVKVTVFERLPHVGGRTSTFSADGFRFDHGPTFFLYPQVLQEILASVGRDLFEEIPMVKLDPQYRLVFGASGELLATPNLDQLRANIAVLSPRDGEGFTRFYEANRRKLAAFAPFLSSPFQSWKDVLRPDLLQLLPLLQPWKSLHTDLAGYFSDQRVRLAFSFQSKYLGMSPFRCPSLFSILSFMEYEYGVYHPIGGCGAVTQALARIAESLGVEIRLNQPVERIRFSGRRAIGVEAGGDYTPCDSLVINGDFARAMKRLVPDHLRRRWRDAKIEKKKFSCSTFMMYLGIRGRCNDLSHHTIYIAKDYEKSLQAIERDHVLCPDPSFYVQNASINDASLATEGMSTLYALFPVTHQHPNVDWGLEKDKFRSVALAQLKKVGLDIEDRVVYERVITPDDWDQQFELHLGSTFSLSHTYRQMLHLRPRNRFEDLDSVYLVGGGTHPGSGLPVIFESSRITTRLLLRDLGISSEFLATGINPIPALAEAM